MILRLCRGYGGICNLRCRRRRCDGVWGTTGCLPLPAGTNPRQPLGVRVHVDRPIIGATSVAIFQINFFKKSFI